MRASHTARSIISSILKHASTASERACLANAAPGTQMVPASAYLQARACPASRQFHTSQFAEAKKKKRADDEAVSGGQDHGGSHLDAQGTRSTTSPYPGPRHGLEQKGEPEHTVFSEEHVNLSK